MLLKTGRRGLPRTGAGMLLVWTIVAAAVMLTLVVISGTAPQPGSDGANCDPCGPPPTSSEAPVESMTATAVQVEDASDRVVLAQPTTAPPAPPTGACATTAHFVWPFTMPLGCREAIAMRALLGPLGPVPPGLDVTDNAHLPWTRVQLHVADRAVAEVDVCWADLINGPTTPPAIPIEVVPLRLPALFRDTPLEQWIRELTLWKVLSGPDFPYQLDLAVRLAIAYKHGGHVFPADFLRHARWQPPSTPYAVRGPSGPGTWPAEVGPFCAAAGDARLHSALQTLSVGLDACVVTGTGIRADPGAVLPPPCVLSLDDLWTGWPAGAAASAAESRSATDCVRNHPEYPTAGGSDGDWGAPGSACAQGLVLTATALWTLVDTQAGTDHAVNHLVGDEPTAFDDFVMSTGKYAGAYLAHRLIGQRRLPTVTPIVKVMAAYGCDTCREPGYPWHQGCNTRAPLKEADWLARPTLSERLRGFRAPSDALPHLSSFAILFASVSTNLGDDIQALAAATFLPFVGYYIDRDQWNQIHPLSSAVPEPARSFRPAEERRSIVNIMNGWWDFMNYEATERNGTAVAQLFVSFHMTKYLQSEIRGPLVVGLLKPREPIGTRDLTTFNYMQRHGVASFFTGCLTTTLTSPWSHVPRTNVLFVPKYDADLEVMQRLVPASVRTTAVASSITLPRQDINYPVKRSVLAWNLLRRYATARVVFTSALHAALPSIAFDSPMIFMHNQAKFREDERFAGLSEVFPHTVLLPPNEQVWAMSNSYFLHFDYAHPSPPSSFSETHAKFAEMRTRLRRVLSYSCPAIELMLAMTSED